MSKKLGDVIGVTVQKGGVGKSTFSQAIAYSYANKGFKTALIDLDPQSTPHASAYTLFCLSRSACHPLRFAPGIRHFPYHRLRVM